LKGADIIAWLNGALISPLPPMAVPECHFKEWIYEMLCATRVTYEVVYLALFLIYRRRMLFSLPQDQLWKVEDRDKMFLAALVLSQKGEPNTSNLKIMPLQKLIAIPVLDDKPFTNKAWEFTSHYHFEAINCMEREFLSDIRYGLLVSREEWEEWLAKLNGFDLYYKLALGMTPLHINHLATPIMDACHRPPCSVEKIAYEAFTTPPANLTPLRIHTTAATSTFYGSHLNSQSNPGPAPMASRKRALETGLIEHQAKRQNIAEARRNNDW
jgi:hypothetical protein